ncbi:hypothetical protein KEM56_006635 [Ascosphaera pollenicola]|nr:hypothetical protein KEM56_006635 [Ascosphaera pollenicola]
MYALPVRSMLYPNEQLPPYSPRWDPETSSILSSAPSYTSAAPSYHSAVPSYHTTDNDNDNDTIHGGQRETGPWGASNSYSTHYSSCIFNLNSEPTSTSTPETSSSQRHHHGGSTSRLPSPDYAPGFESRALRHGNPSDTQLRMLYNTSSWVPVNNGLQSRAYENVARRRAQRTQAEAMLLRSRPIPGGFQSLTDVSRLEGLGRQRSTTNLAAAAAVVSSPSSSSSTREAVVSATTGAESLRSPLTNALYGLMNASTTSVAATVRGEEPSAHIATPAQREHSVEPPGQIPEEEDDGPVSPHEDPFLVGEEAAARARNQRLYITSQTHENHLHGILTTAVPDTVFGVSRPTTPFAGERNRPRGQSDAGSLPSTARPQYTSLVEQGLQARAQRSRSASTSNVPTMSASNSTTTTTNSRSPSISIQTPTPTRPRLIGSRSRSSSASPCPSLATLSPPTPTLRVTGAPASSTSSSLSPPTPSVKLTCVSCTNLLPVTPESDEEHLQVIPDNHSTSGRSSSRSNNDTPFPLSSFLPPPHRRPSRTGRSRSPMTTESRSSSSSLLPPLRASVTAPQERARQSDSTDSSTGSERNGRVSPSQEAMLIAQESKQWDFMMSQMADWEERQRTWKKYRDHMERKFCSGRRLGFHGIIGWSPFHGHSLRSAAKKEEKTRGRKRAVSNGAQTSGSWRRRVVGLPA